MSDAMPMKLAEAASKYGLPSESTIKTEARRGNIKPFRMGRCLYVTDEDMQGMIEKCRENSSPRASNCAPARAVNPSMSSATGTTSGARDMVLNAAAKLRKH